MLISYDIMMFHFIDDPRRGTRSITTAGEYNEDYMHINRRKYSYIQQL